MAAILVVDRDPQDMPDCTQEGLLAEHSVEMVADWTAVRRAIGRHRPDAIVVRRPAGELLRSDLCRQVRRVLPAPAIPIIALVPASAPRTRIRCLEDGADDVLDEDVSPYRLWDRIATLIAMANRSSGGERLAHGAIEMSLDSHRVCAAGRPLTLNRTSFAILRAFLERPETILSRREIAQTLDRSRAIQDRTIDAHIRTLRQAMRPAGVDDLIVTIPQAGYMLCGR